MGSFSKEKFNLLHYLVLGGGFGVFHWSVLYLLNLEFETRDLLIIYVVLIAINILTSKGGSFLTRFLPDQKPMLLLLAKTANMIFSLVFLLVAKYTSDAFSITFAIHFSIAYLMLLVLSTKYQLSLLKTK